MKFCPSCGIELRPGARFCVSCGTNLQSNQSQPYVQEPQQQAQANYAPPPTLNTYPHPSHQHTFEHAGYNPPVQQPTYAGQQANSGFLARILNIITKPKTEWYNVLNETPAASKTMTYAIVLLLIPSICSFIGYSFVGIKMFGIYYKSLASGLQQGLSSFLVGIISLYLTAMVINMLATSFDSRRDFGRSLQLVVYGMTPFWVAGIFFLVPTLSPIVFLSGLYIFYLIYKGMPVLMQTPTHKAAGYLIVSVIVMIIVQVIVFVILGVILGLFFAARMGAF